MFARCSDDSVPTAVMHSYSGTVKPFRLLPILRFAICRQPTKARQMPDTGRRCVSAYSAVKRRCDSASRGLGRCDVVAHAEQVVLVVPSLDRSEPVIALAPVDGAQ